MALRDDYWSEPINLLNTELQGQERDVPTPPRILNGRPDHDGFRVGALNVNSIKDNDRRQAVENHIRQHLFDIFVVIESKLHITDKFEHPDNYAIERKDRRYKKKYITKKESTGEPTKPNPRENRGGGILIYIHESVDYKVKSMGEYAESNVEFLHIEITSPVQLHLVALYCPAKILVDHLISLMSYFMDPLDDKKIMFIGDTNIDRYGKQPQDKLGNKFFEVLTRRPYEVNQLIDQSTHRQACIDHIFTNMKHLESGVMENCISSSDDAHKSTYCTLQDPVLQRKKSESEAFMQNLRSVFIDHPDACILAIFYKFPKKVVAPAVVTLIEGTFSMDEELAYYQAVANIRDMDRNMNKIDEFVTQVDKTEEMRQHGSAVHKQCIIFARKSQSRVFHALQKKMWYKDWDFVWQPRHVEFLGYELEPSLTWAYRLRDGQYLERNAVDENEMIELQDSSYRYCSEKIKKKWSMKKFGVIENEA